jgi:hypothetical protein
VYTPRMDGDKLPETKTPHKIGVTESERYLSKLCHKSFLSLWSHPNPYRAKNKELADLLVVCGDHIVIFSDKRCGYPTEGTDENTWNRWFKKSVVGSAKQLWGAERWIKTFPDKVFVDKEATNKFLFNIDPKSAHIHLVAVAHGAATACQNFFGGGSGSLLLNSHIRGLEQHTQPFYIGDLDPTKTFVHVFDDTTLDIIMQTLDTTTDFVSYLKKKELLFRSGPGILATGEEDLLPSYLTKMKGEEHDFVFPTNADTVALGEGTWERFCGNPQRKAQIEENKISYFIDSLIEGFNKHALAGTQYKVSPGGIKDSEKVLRFFARESRFKRRLLAKAILGLIQSTEKNKIGRRFIFPLPKQEDTHYVFVAFPWLPEKTEEENRSLRSEYLYACCLVVRLLYPNAKDIVGFSTESGRGEIGSEDSLYLDGRHWDEKLENEARKLREELKILIDPTPYKVHDKEYPDVTIQKMAGSDRNRPCPCGSGVKWKRCHGRLN